MKGESRSITALFVAAAVVGAVVFFVRWAAELIGPIALGWFIASLSTPGYRWLRGRRLSRSLALLVIVAVLVLGAAGLGLLAYTSVTRLQEGLDTYQEELAARLPGLHEQLGSAGVPSEVERVISPETLVDLLLVAVDAILSVVQTLAFSTVLAALLLLESGRFRRLLEGALGRLPIFAQLPAVAASAITYIGVRARVNLVTAAGTTVVLLVLGVDYALLWGVGAFFLSFIPYLGLVLALLPPTILAFAEHGTVRALLVVVAGMAINVAAENVLEPLMTGRALRISTTVVFVSFFFWAWVLGPLGALLSMPITVLLMLLFGSSVETQWLAQLIGTASADADGLEQVAATANE